MPGPGNQTITSPFFSPDAKSRISGIPKCCLPIPMEIACFGTSLNNTKKLQFAIQVFSVSITMWVRLLNAVPGLLKPICPF